MIFAAYIVALFTTIGFLWKTNVRWLNVFCFAAAVTSWLAIGVHVFSFIETPIPFLSLKKTDGFSTDLLISFNIDKLVTGLSILFCYWLVKGNIVFQLPKAKVFGNLILTLVLLFTVLWAFGLPISPKQNLSITLITKWIWYNLLVVSLCEEVFFRLLIQEGLNQWTKKLSPIITSLLFVVAHGAVIDFTAFAMYFTVSLFYAFYYQITRSVLFTTIVHFSFNLFHLLLFQYPYQM